MSTNTLTLTRIHNPIYRTDRDTINWAYIPGQSLAEIRATLPAEITFSVSINGQVVLDERLHEFHPVPGDHIVFMPVLSGGEDGKAVGRIIGMIVLTVVAALIQQYELMPAIWGMSAATTSAIVAGAVLIVGGLVINCVLPEKTIEAVSYEL